MKKNGKRVRQEEQVSNQKRVTSIVNPDAYLKKHPSWSFCLCDREHERWSIIKRHCLDDILKRLISFEGMTWANIQAAAGGRREGTNNHFENISDLIKEAQKRLGELHIYEDQVFSLRLSGTERLYGLIENGVFFVIWYDSNHEIYPMSKGK